MESSDTKLNSSRDSDFDEEALNLQKKKRLQRKRRSRISEKVEHRINRQTTNRTHMREARQSESSEKRESRQPVNKIHMRKARQSESPERRESRQTINRMRMREARQNESPERRQTRQSENRRRMEETRREESPATTSSHRITNRNRHSQQRAVENTVERLGRLEGERLRRRHLQIGVAGSSILPAEHYIGELDVQCIGCGALHFEGEPNEHGNYNVCCNHGSVVINPFTNFPEEIKHLLIEDTISAKNFRKYIRNYNNALAMASMGAQLDVSKGRGPYCFRIHDQVYHFIGPLHPDGGKPPIYGQVYILDTDTALEERMSNTANVQCDPNIMNYLGTYITEHNNYAKSFKMMKDVVEQEEKKAKQENRSAEPVKMIFDINHHLDKRRFNVPVTSEVAIVFVGDDEEIPLKRSYAVHSLGGGLRNIRDIDPECDPLVYPILFPSGQPGWHTELRKSNGKRISQMDYYSSMIQGQTASDRPDIIARVFHLKLKELFDDLFKKNVLGEVAAYVSVIEFQKRGLPHSHNLIIMKRDYKPTTSAIINNYVSAEIPDPEKEPRLYGIVKSMVHRPCGLVNPQAPCMINGKCSKHFPKEYHNETVLEGDSYPKYRRRNDGRTIEIGNQSVDNRWIVPYNPYLSSKYNCHINLEVCALISAVMYLYKYVYKGTDQAALKLTQNTGTDFAHDEIRAYLKTRYVCAPEAAHRIYGFDMQKRSHSVEVLSVHLENEETVTFENGQEMSALAERRDTTLLAWFKKNHESLQLYGVNVTNSPNDSRQYTYNEMPEHFTFRDHKWHLRKQICFTIGRMYCVSPKEQERFSLRLLLIHRKGITSFENLKTVGENIFPSFTETAKELDLLHDDSYFFKCIEESSLFQTPRELRSLLACLIIFTDVLNPEEIWTSFEEQFCSDFLYQGYSQEESVALAYYEILDKTARQGVDLTTRITLPRIQRPLLHEDNTDFNACRKKGEEMYCTLNDAQKLVVDEVLIGIEMKKQKLIYIDGPGGSGKTYVYNTLHNILKSRRAKVVKVAWTGIAADLLPYGRTVSSMFRLPIHSGIKTSNMKRQSSEAQYLKSVDVICWDEAPMSPKEALEAVNLLLQDIMCNTIPFGGKTIILGGDFRQILPVVEHGGEEEFVNACIKKSVLWPLFTLLTLTFNMRLAVGNHQWSEYLLRVGNDREEKDDDSRIVLPAEIVLEKTENLIDFVYGDVLNTANSSVIVNRAILMPKNIDALKMNEDVLNKMAGEAKVYIGIDEAQLEEYEEQTMIYEQEFLNRLTPSGFPPNELKLKEGAIVMLLRNLDVDSGLCNGTRLIIKKMGKRVLGCEIVTGTKKGNFVLIPRIDNYTDKNLPFRFKRRQFPVRLSFAMTINKGQGQSFERIGLSLIEEVFSHGQLYVALSRVRSKDGIKVEIQDNDRKTRNIVYRDVI